MILIPPTYNDGRFFYTRGFHTICVLVVVCPQQGAADAWTSESDGWQTYIGSALITCVEDINADGNINVTDVLMLLSNWGSSGDGAEVAAPYDVIDVSDVLAIISALGGCP